MHRAGGQCGLLGEKSKAFNEMTRIIGDLVQVLPCMHNALTVAVHMSIVMLFPQHWQVFRDIKNEHELYD